MHLLCWLLTPSSLVLPWETDGSSGKMDIRISQGLGDSDGWLLLGIVVPQNSLWLWPLHVAHSRAQPGWGFGERLKSSFQTNTAGIQTQGAARIHHKSHSVQGQRTDQEALFPPSLWGTGFLRGPFRPVLGMC